MNTIAKYQEIFMQHRNRYGEPNKCIIELANRLPEQSSVLDIGAGKIKPVAEIVCQKN